MFLANNQKDASPLLPVTRKYMRFKCCNFVPKINTISSSVSAVSQDFWTQKTNQSQTFLHQLYLKWNVSVCQPATHPDSVQIYLSFNMRSHLSVFLLPSFVLLSVFGDLGFQIPAMKLLHERKTSGGIWRLREERVWGDVLFRAVEPSMRRGKQLCTKMGLTEEFKCDLTTSDVSVSVTCCQHTEWTKAVFSGGIRSGLSPEVSFLTWTTQREILRSGAFATGRHSPQDSGEGWSSRQEVTDSFCCRDHMFSFTAHRRCFSSHHQKLSWHLTNKK